MRGSKKRPLVVAAVSGALVVGAVAVASSFGGPDDGAPDPRAGSVVREGAEPVEIRDAPESYRITYRVETGPPDDRITSTDVVAVARPFASRTETWDGPEVQGAPDTVQVGGLGTLLFDAGDGQPLVLARPPDPGPSDLRLDVTLEPAAAAGLVERREVREVLGRRCTVHRTGGPVTAGSFTPPTSDERTDTCVDADGLVLEEVYALDDEVVLRRIATAVEVGAELDPVDFEVEAPTIPVDKGGGSFLEVDPDSRPLGEFRDLEGSPRGFTRVGRFAVVPAQAGAFADPALRATLVASTADVFERGADLLVVDQGATLEGAAPFTSDPDAEVVRVAGVGAMKLVVTPQHVELRADLGGGRFLRVLGTVDVGALAEVAARLVRTEGDGLVYLERP